MNWLNRLRPGIQKISGLLRRSGAPENYWLQCPQTGRLAPRTDVEKNLWVFPEPEHHFPVNARERLDMTFDSGWTEVPIPQTSQDSLKFRDNRRYADRLKTATNEVGNPNAVVVGLGTIENLPAVVAAHDFRFIGGTLAIAEGEAIITGFETAIAHGTPFVVFTASGGARMQEGIFAVMQMPRTTVAVMKMHEVRLPYIVVLCSPTMGGVTASYGMLGDIIIAEPCAKIGFAGERVIRDTLKLPEHYEFPAGFQTAEWLLEHGMVDMIVHRRDMREMLARLHRLLAVPQQVPA